MRNQNVLKGFTWINLFFGLSLFTHATQTSAHPTKATSPFKIVEYHEIPLVILNAVVNKVAKGNHELAQKFKRYAYSQLTKKSNRAQFIHHLCEESQTGSATVSRDCYQTALTHSHDLNLIQLGSDCQLGSQAIHGATPDQRTNQMVYCYRHGSIGKTKVVSGGTYGLSRHYQNTKQSTAHWSHAGGKHSDRWSKVLAGAATACDGQRSGEGPNLLPPKFRDQCWEKLLAWAADGKRDPELSVLSVANLVHHICTSDDFSETDPGNDWIVRRCFGNAMKNVPQLRDSDYYGSQLARRCEKYRKGQPEKIGGSTALDYAAAPVLFLLGPILAPFDDHYGARIVDTLGVARYEDADGNPHLDPTGAPIRGIDIRGFCYERHFSLGIDNRSIIGQKLVHQMIQAAQAGTWKREDYESDSPILTDHLDALVAAQERGDLVGEIKRTFRDVSMSDHIYYEAVTNDIWEKIAAKHAAIIDYNQKHQIKAGK